ncbi:MAG: hypothetical protein WCP34_16050, partial [Pseudomonadota bacterium]
PAGMRAQTAGTAAELALREGMQQSIRVAAGSAVTGRSLPVQGAPLQRSSAGTGPGVIMLF